MQATEDLGAVLDAIRRGLQARSVPLRQCGANLVDTAAKVPTVMTHSMDANGEWHSLPSASAQTVLRFWLRGEVVYRPDLRQHDPFDELRYFERVVSVVDVPFAQGTLAMSSDVPDAFSPQDIELLEEMAGVLESGLQRLEEVQLAQARHRLREGVWRLRRREDLDAFVVTLRDTLLELDFRFHACAVNLIEAGDQGLEVRSHNMRPDGAWTRHQILERPSLLERLWRLGRPAYRRDLDTQDEFGEREILHRVFGVPIRSVLDVPFTHGTLAVNSTEPDAFTADQVQELAQVVAVLQEALRRMDDLATLEASNRALQAEIAQRRQAEADLQTALQDKDVLMREVHHRVKNNLQIVCSLLSLQEGRADDARVLALFRNCRSRIETMARIHEALHQSADVTRLDCRSYLGGLADNVRTSTLADPQQVALHVEVSPVSIDLDTAIRCGLIVNELLLNSFQHAFPEGRPGTVRLGLRLHAGGVAQLTVADDGVGLPPGFDLAHPPSLGLQLVTTVAKQLKGTIECHPGPGTRFELRFPVVPM